MLSTDEVKHIALLARIGLEEKEIAQYGKELSRVLDWMSELQNVDTEGIFPIGHITGMENKAARDVIAVASPAEKERIVKNFPDMKDGYVKVRSVF